MSAPDIQRAIKNQPSESHGDGIHIRDWCYVGGMVDGVLLAIVRPKESYNQRAVRTIYSPANTCDSRCRIQVTGARALLGFEAKVDPRKGIRRTAEYYPKVCA